MSLYRELLYKHHSNNTNCLRDFKISLSGFGILKIIGRKMLELKEIAALITLLVCHRRIVSISLFMTMRKLPLIQKKL